MCSVNEWLLTGKRRFFPPESSESLPMQGGGRGFSGIQVVGMIEGVFHGVLKSIQRFVILPLLLV